MPDSIYLGVVKSIRTRTTWYRCVQHLGTGGNAVTYLVFATSGEKKGTLYALKIFRKLSAQERRDAFLAEINFLNDCDHPAIMRAYDSGIYKDNEGAEFPFVVAEYLPETLYDLIRRNQASVPQKISYILQLLSALKYLSALATPVVHRDIKPQNIFIKGGSCVLGDFGLMKRLDGNVEVDREIFKESIGPGMPFFYRTPNLIAYANNEAELSVKSDIFQLGLVATELFTGRNPAIRNDNHLAPLELENIRTVPGGLGLKIRNILERMLYFNWDNIEEADALMDHWQGLFETSIKRAHSLNGKVY